MFRNSLKAEGVGLIRMVRTNAAKIRSTGSSCTLPVIIAKTAIVITMNTIVITMNTIRISFTVSVEGLSGGSALFLLFVLLDMENPFYEINVTD